MGAVPSLSELLLFVWFSANGRDLRRRGAIVSLVGVSLFLGLRRLFVGLTWHRHCMSTGSYLLSSEGLGYLATWRVALHVHFLPKLDVVLSRVENGPIVLLKRPSFFQQGKESG